jgi:hypothetical protein
MNLFFLTNNKGKIQEELKEIINLTTQVEESLYRCL